VVVLDSRDELKVASTFQHLWRRGRGAGETFRAGITDPTYIVTCGEIAARASARTLLASAQAPHHHLRTRVISALLRWRRDFPYHGAVRDTERKAKMSGATLGVCGGKKRSAEPIKKKIK